MVSWCCGSPNDVTFSLLSTFTNTHFGKRMQNFCRFVSTDKFTDNFWLTQLSKGSTDMNRQTDNRQILSVCQYRQIHGQILARVQLTWPRQADNRQMPCYAGYRFVSTDKFTDKFWLHSFSSWNEGEMWCGRISSLENVSIKPICIS